MSEWKYFEKAISAAKKDTDTLRAYVLGAVALRADGTLVSSRNGSCQHPTPSTHAEARVLRKAGAMATVYVARIKKDGTVGCARPCPHCLAALINRGAIRCYYTISDSEFGVIEL